MLKLSIKLCHLNLLLLSLIKYLEKNTQMLKIYMKTAYNKV